MRTGFISLKNAAIAIGIIATLITLTFTIKTIAADWGGQINSAQTEQLDPALCVGGGGGDCLGTPPCDPAVYPCVCP